MLVHGVHEVDVLFQKCLLPAFPAFTVKPFLAAVLGLNEDTDTSPCTVTDVAGRIYILQNISVHIFVIG